MNIDNVDSAQRVYLPVPAVVQRCLADAAITFSEQGRMWLQVAFIRYEQSYHRLTERVRAYAEEHRVHTLTMSPDPQVQLHFDRREVDAALREVVRSFRQFAAAFREGRAENTVTEGPELRTLEAMIMRNNEIAALESRSGMTAES